MPDIPTVSELAMTLACPWGPCRAEPGETCKIVNRFGGGGGMHSDRYRLGAEERKRLMKEQADASA